MRQKTSYRMPSLTCAIAKNFQFINQFEQYLYTSVKNGCLHHLKRKHIRQNFTDHILHTTALTEENDSEYEIMYEEIQRRVHQEIGKLPESVKNIQGTPCPGKRMRKSPSYSKSR